MRYTAGQNAWLGRPVRVKHVDCGRGRDDMPLAVVAAADDHIGGALRQDPGEARRPAR